jgi:YtcA family
MIKTTRTTNQRRPMSRLGLLLAVTPCAGCTRAPSFDLLGSFFPAWLVCLACGLLLTVGAHWLFLRLRVVVALPVLTYPSLTALFTFALWLGLFR